MREETQRWMEADKKWDRMERISPLGVMASSTSSTAVGRYDEAPLALWKETVKPWADEIANAHQEAAHRV